MQDKMTEIRGYFKIDSLDKDGNVISTYEDKNTVMARVPELFAGQASGLYVDDIADYVICTLAIGTGGVKIDALGNKIPKSIRDNRKMMFAEEAFWKISEEADPLAVPQIYAVQTEESRVYQQTFTPIARGDLDQNTAVFSPAALISNGSTIPFDINTGYPDPANPLQPNVGYITAPHSTDNDYNTTVEVMNRGKEVKYIFNVGMLAANDDAGVVPYSEAALYMKINSNDILFNPPGLPTENPLGQMFSMKTFEPQYKTESCVLRIEWTLFF